MKIKCKADVLKSLIAIADAITIKNSPTFSDRYIKLSALGKYLEISAGTSEYSCNLRLDDVDIQVAGVICAEDIAHFVKVLDDVDEYISIFDTNSKLNIRRGTKKTGTIQAIPVENFVDRSGLNGQKQFQFSLTVEQLKTIVQASLLLKIDDIKNLALKNMHFESVNGQLTCYFGSPTCMFRYYLKDFNGVRLDIPLQHSNIIKSFLSSKLLQADSSVEIYSNGNQVELKTSIGTLLLATMSIEYPIASVNMMFNTSNWSEVNISIQELAENFDAVDGLFFGYDNVLCTVTSDDDVFYIKNSVKNLEYEGIIDNPDSIPLEFTVNTSFLDIACKFIKDADAKFIVKTHNNTVNALGIRSKDRCFITVPIRREKVSV